MKKLILLFSFFFLMAWIIGLCFFAYQINHFDTDETTHTQAIVVLTGGRNRISEAVKLLNHGLADKLFISGVEKNISLKEISQEQHLQIPDKGDVQLENNSTNTVENAKESAEWIRKNNISSIRLVTSNYHTPRSLEEFYSKNPALKIIPHPVFSDFVLFLLFCAEKYFFSRLAGFLPFTEASIISGFLFAIKSTPLQKFFF